MADATSVRWAPDSSIVSLVSRIIGQHRDALSKRMKDDQGRIVDSAVARGVLKSGGTVMAVREAYAAAVRQYATDVAKDIVAVLQATDGTLDAEAGRWIRDHLEPNFQAVATGILAVMDNDAAIRGLPVHHGDAIATLVAELKRDLGIIVDRTVVRRPTAAPAEPADDAAIMDPLVPLKNRRRYDTDLEAQLKAAANEPLALVAFDIDKFKSVNDDHGGHQTGDEALIAVAQIAAGCARGKGTAYRLGGDEFTVLLPNHTAQEAVAVAERIRQTVSEKPMTSRSLTVTLSIGVAVVPEHAKDGGALKKAADAALYDAKHHGKNLVRVFGEPPPTAPGPREPERKRAESSGVTNEARRQIRQDYFRDGFARCPNDEAMLRIQETGGFGARATPIVVMCPACGLNELIEE